tara:strand:+ start:291 stop:422 length:132 start_codon:yes stop_codon:yes gene_type:complete
MIETTAYQNNAGSKWARFPDPKYINRANADARTVPVAIDNVLM